LRFQGAGAVHGGEGITHVGGRFDNLTTVLGWDADHIEIDERLANVLQHVPCFRDQFLSLWVVSADLFHYLGYRPAGRHVLGQIFDAH